MCVLPKSLCTGSQYGKAAPHGDQRWAATRPPRPDRSRVPTRAPFFVILRPICRSGTGVLSRACFGLCHASCRRCTCAPRRRAGGAGHADAGRRKRPDHRAQRRFFPSARLCAACGPPAAARCARPAERRLAAAAPRRPPAGTQHPMIGYGTYKVGFIPASASAAAGGQQTAGETQAHPLAPALARHPPPPHDTAPRRGRSRPESASQRPWLLATAF